MIETTAVRVHGADRATMHYHFAFLAISIALSGLGASRVCVYLGHRHFAGNETRHRLSRLALAQALATLLPLACLVRIRVGLNYSPENLVLMLPPAQGGFRLASVAIVLFGAATAAQLAGAPPFDFDDTKGHLDVRSS